MSDSKKPVLNMADVKLEEMSHGQTFQVRRARAHQLVNTGKEDLRYLGMSSMGSVDVIDYPDSDKIAVGAGIKNADFKTATYAAVGRLTCADYWDGEDGSERK